jgi:hypothetical protein
MTSLHLLFDRLPVYVSFNFKIFNFFLDKILSEDIHTMSSKFNDKFNKLINKKTIKIKMTLLQEDIMYDD